MEVKDDKIVLPDGMSYRFLVLPHDDRYMTLELLRKIQKMVYSGAIVIGPKTFGITQPERLPGTLLKFIRLFVTFGRIATGLPFWNIAMEKEGYTGVNL